VLESMRQDAGVPIRELRVDGGMVVNDLLMQLQADILDVEVIRPRVAETTALGAAYAAGLAVGYWHDLADLTDNWSMDKCWTSSISGARREHLCGGWQKAVQRTLDWLD
jgi:glycerol kinase